MKIFKFSGNKITLLAPLHSCVSLLETASRSCAFSLRALTNTAFRDHKIKDGRLVRLGSFFSILLSVLVYFTSTMAMTSFVQADNIPEINYRTHAGKDNRMLIFVNNPEVISTSGGSCDLADDIKTPQGTYCGKVLHRLNQVTGNFRNWFEHTNRTPYSLSYAVRVYNPGTSCVNIHVKGKGTVNNSMSQGGREFVDLFSRFNPTDIELCPTQQAYLTVVSGISPAFFFAGVVDFDVKGGSVVIDNLAYREKPAPRTTYMGYTTRSVGRVYESLVYKGISFQSEAEASGVDFTFDDSTSDGRLKVAYRYFQPPEGVIDPLSDAGRCSLDQNPNCRGKIGSYQDTPTISDHWITHIVVDPNDKNPKRVRAVQSDNITLYTPGHGSSCLDRGFEVGGCLAISPFFLAYYPEFNQWLYPNWGNWGVVYTVRGVLRNEGSSPRIFRLGLRADAHSPIAYMGKDRIWRQKTLEKPLNGEQYFTYYEHKLMPGESAPYEAKIVLSGPGAGTLENIAILAKD